jgi:hypothetical protein
MFFFGAFYIVLALVENQALAVAFAVQPVAGYAL